MANDGTVRHACLGLGYYRQGRFDVKGQTKKAMEDKVLTIQARVARSSRPPMMRMKSYLHSIGDGASVRTDCPTRLPYPRMRLERDWLGIPGVQLGEGWDQISNGLNLTWEGTS